VKIPLEKDRLGESPKHERGPAKNGELDQKGEMPRLGGAKEEGRTGGEDIVHVGEKKK